MLLGEEGTLDAGPVDRRREADAGGRHVQPADVQTLESASIAKMAKSIQNIGANQNQNFCIREDMVT